jgi:hypothetical protein
MSELRQDAGVAGAGHNGDSPASADAAGDLHASSRAGAQPPGGMVLPLGGLGTPSDTMPELRRRRLELAERVAALTWDLGGLTYEMAIRDHYRLDVLARRAAELQQADAQLGEVQRLLATAEAGIDGQCRSCGAVRSRGAAYCWHCGAPLRDEARPSFLPVDEPAAAE